MTCTHLLLIPFAPNSYWESTYGQKANESAFTRFEGECHRLYALLDAQLGKQQYIALPDRPTIADYSFFSWVNIAEFGKLDISKYTNVGRWRKELQGDKEIEKADGKLPKK